MRSVKAMGLSIISLTDFFQFLPDTVFIHRIFGHCLNAVYFDLLRFLLMLMRCKILLYEVKVLLLLFIYSHEY